ncbi:MAG: cytidylyltransferase domain-containing protein, partial [Candidatus Woesearchaeota archaeon]
MNESNLKTLGVIPARMKSTRFPGKPLAKIKGIPMIKRVYQQVEKSSLLDNAVVATEDKEIEEYCISENIP